MTFSPWNTTENPGQEPGTGTEVWYEAEWPLARVVGKERDLINGAGAQSVSPLERDKIRSPPQTICPRRVLRRGTT